MTRQFGFLFCRDRGNDMSAHFDCHLCHQQTNAAGSSVQQYCISRLQWKSRMGKIMRCHALQQNCSSLLKGNGRGNMHQVRFWNDGILGIGAQVHAPCHIVAHLEILHSFARFDDDARALLPWSQRQCSRVHPFPVIDVDEVDSNGSNFDENLIGSWSGARDFRQMKAFDTSGLRNLHGFHEHALFSLPTRKPQRSYPSDNMLGSSGARKRTRRSMV